MQNKSRSKFIADFLHQPELEPVIHAALADYTRKQASHWVVFRGSATQCLNRDEARDKAKRMREEGGWGFVYYGPCVNRSGGKSELILEV
jgi:hypothetical protein